MKKVTLYEFESPDIKISMEIYFNEKNELIFDGYDMGKKVSEAMGDSDYEYTYCIKYEEAEKMANFFDIDIADRMAFLKEIKNRFNGNSAYSEFGAFMRENNIQFDAFTWR